MTTRRGGAALAMALIALVTVIAPSDAAAPFLQLKPLALTASEIGAGYRIRTERALVQRDSTGYYAEFTNQNGSLQGLLVIDEDDELVEQPELAAMVIDQLTRAAFDEVARRAGGTVTREAPPMVGEHSARYTYTGVASGTRIAGDAIGWHHGPLFGLIFVVGAPQPSAQFMAQAQQAKFVQLRPRPEVPVATPSPAPRPTPPANPAPGTAPTLTPPTRPTVAQPPSTAEIDCASFTHQEAAQALLAARPSDPFRLDPDRNGIACEMLPTRGAGPAPLAPSTLPTGPSQPSGPPDPATPPTSEEPTPASAPETTEASGS